MDRIVSLRSTIKLFLVIALSLALSCVTAPGIRTSDVAELHYGDREEVVVEKLGEGSEVLYFVLDGKQYRYRLYTTQYTKHAYALLFMNSELIAVHDEKQDFSECLNVEASQSWEECLSDLLSEMRFYDITMGNHDFSPEIEAEQGEEDDRQRARGTYAAIAVPLTVAFPYVVATLCAFSCGACLLDPGERPGDHQDLCISKLESTLSQSVDIFQEGADHEFITQRIAQIQHEKKIYNAGSGESIKDDQAILYYSWGCSGYDINPDYLSIRVGLSNKKLKWAWIRCASNTASKQYELKLWRLNKEIGSYCPNADQGHADAQKHIGDLYYFGTDEINIDLIRAHVWYSLAAKSGNKEASELLDHLVKELSPQQLSKAQIQLDEWKPGQCQRDLMEAIPQGYTPVIL